MDFERMWGGVGGRGGGERGEIYGSCRENCPGIEEGILLPKLQTILYIFLHMFLFVGVKLQCQEIFWPKLIEYGRLENF